MTNKINKFDALAYAVAVLGQPHEVYKNRSAEALFWLVPDVHTWSLPCGRWLAVDEWLDGDQSTRVGACAATWDYPIAIRNNDDGTLCPEYEEQARALIDAYAKAVR